MPLLTTPIGAQSKTHRSPVRPCTRACGRASSFLSLSELGTDDPKNEHIQPEPSPALPSNGLKNSGVNRKPVGMSRALKVRAERFSVLKRAVIPSRASNLALIGAGPRGKDQDEIIRCFDDVARASRPLWRGHPAAPRVRRPRHSRRDACAT